jgi:RNA polymerase sigma factor (sigma-70 family)
VSRQTQPPSKPKARPDAPYHVSHESFTATDAESLYGPDTASGEDFSRSHLPDDRTRDLAKRMHYAAWRAASAGDERTRRRWHAAYLCFRDRVVVGNRKLIFRAVQRWSPPAGLAEDMAGDCSIVLLQAVAAYNPWMGVRFSTYAFTCLMRALSRLSQRHARDRLARSLPLEALADGEPSDAPAEGPPVARLARVDELLREGNELLSLREKMVLVRRFSLDDDSRTGTLEQVGKELGLSKERVRQVQASALDKLRKALDEQG